MDFGNTFTALKDASPLVMILFAVMWLANRFLTYRERKTEDDRFVTLRDGQNTLNTNLRAITSELTQYQISAAGVAERQLALLERLDAHMITASASQGSCKVIDGEECSEYRMSTANQRHIIHYQWSWCRNEVINTISASIQKNGIKGREATVARRILQSFKQAAQDALYSVERLKGMTYPFDTLFKDTADSLWPTIWDIAIPLYKRSVQCDLESSLEELQEKIIVLFEDALQAHFIKYDDDPATGRLTRAENVSDNATIASMASKLRDETQTLPGV